MKTSQFNLIAKCIVGMGIVLFAISFWIGKVTASVLLFAAVAGMAEILALSFKYKKLFDVKLMYFTLLLLFMGRWFLLIGCQQVADALYLAVVILGAVFILRFHFWLNKYCSSDVESKLDEPNG